MAPPGQHPTTEAAQALHDEILDSLQARIRGLKTPLHYRLGMLVVALAMVLLPMIYLGLIALAGYGISEYAVHGTGVFDGVRGRSTLWALMIYLGPLAVGCILILFMIKPLFARPAKAAKPHKLEAEDEPLLFAFVERLCRVVGTRAPREIRVDTEVNASAGFRRGIRSFLGGDLVLTIGLPLVAGCSLRQLAGVLAHEFGHFAQRAGMRLTFVIRTVRVIRRAIYRFSNAFRAVLHAGAL